MGQNNDFLIEELLKKAYFIAREIKETERIKCVSHYDCDGISSAVIAKKALERSKKEFEIQFVNEIDENLIKNLKNNDHDLIIFLDIGSGYLELLETLNKKIIVADHHFPSKANTKILHLNPCEFGIDGGKYISGAGVSYLLFRMLSTENRDLVPFALIGATGDLQKEDEEFLGLNKSLIQDAENLGLIKRKKGLKIFGRNAKSITTALAYTTEPYIPGLTGNESRAVKFLSELNIPIKNGPKLRTLNDLNFEEERKIADALATLGCDMRKLIGDIFLLKNGWEIGEFATVLNACGRLEKPWLGIEICLSGNMNLALEILREYSRRISKYLDIASEKDLWLESRVCSILNAKDKIHENFIGTISSIKKRETQKAVIGLCYTQNGSIKISARNSEFLNSKGVFINELMKEICALCKGYGGGHKYAAGGKIPREQEDNFIRLVRDAFKRFEYEDVL
jgi:single-stranded-DNA-specific exonuclease